MDYYIWITIKFGAFGFTDESAVFSYVTRHIFEGGKSTVVNAKDRLAGNFDKWYMIGGQITSKRITDTWLVGDNGGEEVTARKRAEERKEGEERKKEREKKKENDNQLADNRLFIVRVFTGVIVLTTVATSNTVFESHSLRMRILFSNTKCFIIE